MRLTMSKKDFLANPSNKQALVNLIAVDMSRAGIIVKHSQGEADHMICLLACSSAKDKPTVVVADDTDVFQLSIDHADSTNAQALVDIYSQVTGMSCSSMEDGGPNFQISITTNQSSNGILTF